MATKLVLFNWKPLWLLEAWNWEEMPIEDPLQPKNLGNISNNICVSLLTAVLRVPMGLEGGRARREGCVFSFLHMNDSKENAEIDLRRPCMYILKLVVALKWSRGT